MLNRDGNAAPAATVFSLIGHTLNGQRATGEPQPSTGHPLHRQTVIAEAPERPVQTVKPSTPTRCPPETVQPARRPQNSHQTATRARKDRTPAAGRSPEEIPPTTRKAVPVRPSLTGQAVAHPVGCRRLQVQPVKAKQAGSLHRARGPFTFPGKLPARVRETVTFRVQVKKMQIRQVSKKADISEDPGIV